MPLPSQSSRTSRHGRHVYRRQRSNRRLPLTIVGLGVLIALGWLFWPQSPQSPTPVPDGPDDAAVAANTSTHPNDNAPVDRLTAPTIGDDGDRVTSIESRQTTADQTSSPPPPTTTHAAASVAPPSPAVTSRTPRVTNTVPVRTVDLTTDSVSPLLAPLTATTTMTMTAADLLGSTPPLAMPQPVLSAAIAADLDRGTSLLSNRDPVAAREVFSKALASGQLDQETSNQVRSLLASINDRLVFGPDITVEDPFTVSYKVQPGDSLSRIASRNSLKTNWRLIQRVNGISRPERLRVGQTLKLIKGPFHAEIDKDDYRLDLYLGEGGSRVFVRSLTVGLGALDSTPTGLFRIRTGSKLVNPPWTNPRTGEYFEPNDPLNPIGEHWLGFEGIEARTKDLQGYGIHGTIEPSSIGMSESMGCVRLLDDDVALLYETLTEGNSTVVIRR